MEHICAVCIYIAARKLGQPIIHKRFMGIKGIREKVFNKCVSIITAEENNNGNSIIQASPGAEYYIENIN